MEALRELSKEALRARVAELEVLADQIQVTALTGDGVIVATPTGSTAYSMSAGGPIVEPTSQSIIVTPVCAHQLGARPMVLSPERTVTVRLPRGNRKHLYLSVDGGKAVRMSGGDRAEIRRSVNSFLDTPAAATTWSRSQISTGRLQARDITSAYWMAKGDISPTGEYFLNTTSPSVSVKISSGSPSLMRIVRRISFGMTTRPRSSILLTMPVAFIVSSPLKRVKARFYR